MLRRGAEDESGLTWRGLASPIATAATLGACAAVVALSWPDRVDSLSVILGVAAIAAGILVVGEQGGLGVSGSFIVFVLAGAFLGPASAAGVAVLAELAATATMRTPWRVVVYTNLPSAVAPAVAAAILIRAVAPANHHSAGFFLTVALAAMVALVTGFTMFSLLRRLAFPTASQFGWDTLVEFLPSAGLSILVAVAGVSIQVEVGNAGIAFALAAVFAFSYMAHLLKQSRKRAQQYVSLSWGVLAGLMRSLDIRDGRTARHSAAVAQFARDIAREVGMSESEQELAHTAGLLHDIGRFALSDRVAERGRPLNNDDWEAIWQHPELGADMLRDLGMYGPVAEIVLTHHERLDGRGYPSGLTAEEIPEIAKIIAVAEIYDTLTASDTYRTRMSSFEVLAGLLSGEGVEYRHADLASFDKELDMERRINQAGAGG